MDIIGDWIIIHSQREEFLLHDIIIHINHGFFLKMKQIKPLAFWNLLLMQNAAYLNTLNF